MQLVSRPLTAIFTHRPSQPSSRHTSPRQPSFRRCCLRRSNEGMQAALGPLLADEGPTEAQLKLFAAQLSLQLLRRGYHAYQEALADFGASRWDKLLTVSLLLGCSALHQLDQLFQGAAPQLLKAQREQRNTGKPGEQQQPTDAFSVMQAKLPGPGARGELQLDHTIPRAPTVTLQLCSALLRALRAPGGADPAAGWAVQQVLHLVGPANQQLLLGPDNAAKGKQMPPRDPQHPQVLVPESEAGQVLPPLLPKLYHLAGLQMLNTRTCCRSWPRVPRPLPIPAHQQVRSPPGLGAAGAEAAPRREHGARLPEDAAQSGCHGACRQRCELL